MGNAGRIELNTNSLSVNNNAALSASTLGKGNGGVITINATDSVSFDESGNAFNTVEATGVGDAGGIQITTSTLSLTNGGQLVSATLGQGNAGNVTVNANSISLDGEDNQGTPSGIFSQVGDAKQLVIPEGNAGRIEIKTNSLSVKNDAQLSASTFGKGNGGSININATHSVFFDGGGAFSTVAATGEGTAGGIKITTSDLSLNNGGQLSASTLGQGDAGDITVNANSIFLNQGIIEAFTQSETDNSANITLQLTEDLILSNNSLISARAFAEANGGNINIDADFIVAFPNQNSDIIANASQGNGGNININALSLFGIEERPSMPPNFTNDIDASSEFGLQGDISVNTPEVDPNPGLIELPETVSDATDQISQNICEQGVGSEFIITGKGGLPPNPHETLNSDEEQVGLVEPVPLTQGDRETGNPKRFPKGLAGASRGEEISIEENNIRSEKSTSELVPAQGWIFNDKGEVTLTSYKTLDTETKPSPQKTPNICPTP